MSGPRDLGGNCAISNLTTRLGVWNRSRPVSELADIHLLTVHRRWHPRFVYPSQAAAWFIRLSPFLLTGDRGMADQERKGMLFAFCNGRCTHRHAVVGSQPEDGDAVSNRSHRAPRLSTVFVTDDEPGLFVGEAA